MPAASAPLLGRCRNSALLLQVLLFVLSSWCSLCKWEPEGCGHYNVTSPCELMLAGTQLFSNRELWSKQDDPGEVGMRR